MHACMHSFLLTMYKPLRKKQAINILIFSDQVELGRIKGENLSELIRRLLDSYFTETSKEAETNANSKSELQEEIFRQNARLTELKQKAAILDAEEKKKNDELQEKIRKGELIILDRDNDKQEREFYL